ncbi:MAG: HAMP domain-containing protein [Nitrospinae bacterium]|nr:HAMP domain-containing protein [Nitrospinota bacterium]
MKINFFSRIQNKIFLSLMLAAILPIGYFGYHSIKSASNSLQDDTLRKMYLDVFSRGKDIENHLDNSKGDLLYLRSSAPLEYLLEAIELNDIASFTYWRTLLEKEFFNLVEQKGVYLQVGFLSRNGDEIALVAYDMRHPVILPKSSLHNQRGSSHFYVAANLSQGEVASIPLISRMIKGLNLSNIALIRYITPVYGRSGKWMGAIYLDVTGRHLYDTMKRHIVDKTSRIFLLNNRGFYFLNPEWETEESLLNTGESPDNINDVYSKVVVSQVLSGRSGVVMDDDENLFAYTAVFPDERNKEFYYTVVESYPKNLLTAAVKDYKRLFIATILAAVLLTILIGVFISKMLTHPLSKLKEGVQLIGKGNLDYRLDIRSGDEVEDVAAEFNNMAEKLKIYSRCLEEKVEERTKQVRDYEKQLIHSEKMASLGLLAAGVAHEINNPIGIIINRIEALKMENTNGDIPEKVIKDMNAMMHHAMRVSKITGNLLSFSRESSYEFSPQDINKIIERVLMFLEGSISKKGIILEKSLYNGLPPVFGSAAGLEQVFLNIIHNALDATNGGGKIKVETKNGITPPFPPLEKGGEGGFVNVIISDTGNGISNEYIGKIFDPFFTTKEIGKGTGLGLSISYGIIKEHGGEIRVESEISKGTAFTITVPVMKV